MTVALEGGEWSAARPGRTLPPGKDPVPIVQRTGWAPGIVWTGGKSRLHRDSNPDRPASNSVAIPTELPSPHYVLNKYIKYYLKVLIPAVNWMSEYLKKLVVALPTYASNIPCLAGCKDNSYREVH